MPLCHLPGADLYYVERGEGEPLVFLNGLAGDCLAWMGVLKKLGRQYHCIAIESRDVGQSQYMTQPYSIADLAHDVLGVADQLQLASFHLIGVSMGGMVAQELALVAPDRVRSLVLAQTLARCDDWFKATLKIFEMVRTRVTDTATFFETILPWWVSPSFFSESGRTTWLSWLLRQNPYDQRLEGFLRQLEAIRTHDTLERLSSIHCPVLLVTGEDDQIAPRKYGRELQAQLPHAQHVGLEGVGHALLIEDPRRFEAALLGFLVSQKPHSRLSA